MLFEQDNNDKALERLNLVIIINLGLILTKCALLVKLVLKYCSLF